MQRCLTGCKLLIIAPALFILLQVALALHHRHFDVHHGGEYLLNSFPAVFYPDKIKQDILLFIATEELLLPVSRVNFRTADSPRALIAALAAEPSQSRAPPWILFPQHVGALH